MKVRRKGSHKQKLIKCIIAFETVLILFACSFVVFYHARKAPVIDEWVEMTQMPSDANLILGAKTDQTLSLRIPILLYHYVEYVKDKNDTIRISLNITPYTFEEQVKTLKKAGYTFITPSEIPDMLRGKTKPPAKPVILSFDDGYMDFYTDVFPILKKHRVKAVSYLVPNFLDRPNYMFSYQVETIAESFLVEFGAHTMDHVWLSGISQERAQYQIAQSCKELQKKFDLPFTSLAYPYGAFDKQAIELAGKAGYTNAISTLPGIMASRDNLFFLYRLHPGGRTGQSLLNYLDQENFIW